MDSISQVALGAAVGHLTAGRQVGRRAVAWGAICGTLPDLDVLVRYGSDVANFTYHRSFSHSLIVLALVSPLVLLVVRRVHPNHAHLWFRWLSLIYLSFATHVLLDAFTVYGTQLWWPLDPTPVSWATVFIIDPLFTTPLLVGVGAACFMTRRPERGYRWNVVGFAVAVLYLGWSVGVKSHVDSIARQSLTQQGLDYERLLTVAAPFNTVLWRVLAIDGERYYEGTYSLLDSDENIEFTARTRSVHLLEGLDGHWPVERLQWFTHGFYGVDQIGDDVVLTDLRMGSFDTGYVFRFVVGLVGETQSTPSPDRKLPLELHYDKFDELWSRLRGHE